MEGLYACVLKHRALDWTMELKDTDSNLPMESIVAQFPPYSSFLHLCVSGQPVTRGCHPHIGCTYKNWFECSRISIEEHVLVPVF